MLTKLYSTHGERAAVVDGATVSIDQALTPS